LVTATGKLAPEHGSISPGFSTGLRQGEQISVSGTIEQYLAAW